MDTIKLICRFLMCAGLGLLMSAANSDSLPAQNQGQKQDQEQEIGQEVFNELKARAEIIESSPLYDQLRPISDAIGRAAQPQYNHPFQFYLVHEPRPNAFSAPGGNIYVTDALLYFAKNTEELSGTLCHEVSHTIHHDSIELMKKEKKIAAGEVGAAILLGPTRAHLLAIFLIGRLSSLGYSRDAEEHADLTGSDICAAAGYNPWGLVWLFQDFQNADPNQIPELLSDHPNNQHRIEALEEHFRKNPQVFAKFNSNPKAATAFSVPKKAPVVFLR